MTVSNYHIIPKLAVVDARESVAICWMAKVQRLIVQTSNFPTSLHRFHKELWMVGTLKVAALKNSRRLRPLKVVALQLIAPV